MRAAARLTALYVLFAAAATAANLAMQAAVRALLDAGGGIAGPVYWLALGAGTAAGLVVKYALDRRWIFNEQRVVAAVHTRQFSLYTLTGVATTAIFWGTQTGFYVLWGTEAMLYAGGALGLGVGYFLKYRLDRRFVFEPRPAAA